MTLFFRQKIKHDLSQKKNTWKCDIFFKCSEKLVFPKQLHWNMIFLISWAKMAFLFPRKYDIFLRTKNERSYFSKNTRKYDVFCMLVKLVFLFPTNMKKAKMIFFLKNTPKDDISSITEKDDIHSRKDDIDILCTFTDTFLSVFILLLSNKKTQEI